MKPDALILKNVKRRRLSSALTILNVALGVMLVVAILLVRKELTEAYERPGKGFSFVVGSAKGSNLELVLNTIYHKGVSKTLLPYSTYKELVTDRFVALAVPYALGDSFKGYRVVGTTEDVFSHRFPAPGSESIADKFQEGGPFRCDPLALDAAVGALIKADPDPRWADAPRLNEAVLGATVAKTLGINVGDMIEPVHGVEGAKEHKGKFLWKVTGILKTSRTPMDEVVLINLDSFYRIPDHAGGLSQRKDGTLDASVSAIILFPKGGVNKALLYPRLNVRQDLKVVIVEDEIRWLMSQVGQAEKALGFVVLIVVLIGVLSILVAIYNTMSERRRDIAILRAIGATRGVIRMTIVGEAMALALIGAVLGVFLGHLAIWAFGAQIEEAASFRPNPWQLVLPQVPLVVLAVTIAAGIAGMVPASAAYRTDIAENLRPHS